MQPKLDVLGNRLARKWTNRQLLVRVLWAFVQPLFALSPRVLWGWRNMLLRAFGARIGRDVQIYPSVRIAIPWNLSVSDQAAVGDGALLYNLGPIQIASRVTISQGAHLCAGTHDYRTADFTLRKPPIVIGEGAWICTQAFVGPGVTVGAFAIVGARAVVTAAVDPWTIVAGNPARFIKARLPFQTRED